MQGTNVSEAASNTYYFPTVRVTFVDAMPFSCFSSLYRSRSFGLLCLLLYISSSICAILS